MNTPKLPPLPDAGILNEDIRVWTTEQMQAYAIAAIAAQTVPDVWRDALQRIADWNSHAVMLGVEHGSNGVRDFYRQIAIDALASVPPAPQASKCPTCNDNGLVGGPSFYAPDEGGVPCPDCSQAAVVQQEPVGYAPISAIEEVPLEGYVAVYTHPAQQAKPQPLSDEQVEDFRAAACKETYITRDDYHRAFHDGWRAANGIKEQT